MEQEKMISLLNRQLLDFISQADNVLKEDSSSVAIEKIARHSEEIKSFIKEKVTHPEILEICKDVPTINFKRNRIRLWEILLLPYLILILYKIYHQKNKTIEEINVARGKYSRLQMVTNSIINL